MTKSKAVAILVATHFQYNVSSVFVYLINELRDSVIVVIYVYELTM